MDNFNSLILCVQALYYVTLDQGHSSLLMVPLWLNEASLPQLVFQFVNASITDIAVDWINENIYCINSMSNSIIVWDIKTNVTRDIIGSLDSPRELLYSFSTR